MIQLLLTGLAGVALGIVIMRMMSPTPSVPTVDHQGDDESDDAATPDAANGLASKLRTLSRTQMLLGGAGAIAISAVAIAVLKPEAPLPDGLTFSNNPAMATSAPAGASSLDDVDTMIGRLKTRLEANPTDGEGFRMLGWSLQNTGRPQEAVDAYRKAIKLLPTRADVHAGLGETLVLVAQDKVTAEAKAAFDDAIRIDPKEPRARFFLSLYKAQNGQERAALDEWISLSNSAPADQPWQADVQKRASALAAKLGVDITGKMKPAAVPAPTVPMTAGTGSGPDAATMQAASALPTDQRSAMIDGMVEGLAARLKANPNDAEGWIKLIRSRIVLKDQARARDDLAMARKAFAADAAKLSQVNAAAAELGLQ